MSNCTRSRKLETLTHRIATCGAALVILILLSACDRKAGNLSPLEFSEAPMSPKTITLIIKNICPTLAGYRVADIFALQSTMRLEEGKIRIDYDRDGLSNSKEAEFLEQYNTAFDNSDTNGDGYSDPLMVTSGFSRDEQQSLHACPSPAQDTDLDGLTDCEEENILHTNPNDPDSDNDGIIDGLETRFGLNPSDPADAIQDPDNDGQSNYVEVKANTPPIESNTENVTRHALSYNLTSSLVNGQECIELKLSNIPLFQVGNGNLIRFYVLEKKPPAPSGEGTINRTVFTYKNVPIESQGSVLEMEYEELIKTSN